MCANMTTEFRCNSDAVSVSSWGKTATTVSESTSSCEQVANATPPCEHNCWTRSRRHRNPTGVRLRCLVCLELWVADLSKHRKCSAFYAGKCKGDCGKPHIHARGTIPQGLSAEQREERLNTRCLKELVVVPATTNRRAKMLAKMPEELDTAHSDTVSVQSYGLSSSDDLMSSPSTPHHEPATPLTPCTPASPCYRHDPYSADTNVFMY